MRGEKAVTAVVLNWQRQSNIDEMTASIRSQTVPVRIVLWHNGVEPAKRFDCDEYYVASRNHICWPRWFAASQASTPWVFCMDDDLRFAAPAALESLLAQHERHAHPGSVTGIEGVLLRPGCGYFPTYRRPWMRRTITDELDGSSVHLGYVENPTYVDIIKGRFMLMRTADLELPMRPAGHDYADDIAVCGLLARGRAAPHLLAATPHEHFADFDDKEGPMALCRQPFITDAREAGRRFYFPHV